MQKGFSLILMILIGLVVLGLSIAIYEVYWRVTCPNGINVNFHCEGLGYIPSGKITPSSTIITWELYSNPEYNVSFKYPSNLIQDPSVYNPTPSKMLVLQFYSSDKKIQFNLWTSNLRDDLKDEHGFEGVKQLSIDTVIVGGHNGTLTTYETDTTNQMSENSPPSYISEIYVVSLKDMPLDMQYSGPRDSISRQQLDQILSTFKFTDQTSTADTSSWKTYQGKYYSFKYPSNWTNDVSGQQYSETGTLIHTNDIMLTDYSNFQKGASLNTSYVSEEPLVDPELTSIDSVFSKSLTAPEDMSLLSTSDLMIGGQPAKEKIYKGSGAEIIQLVFEYPNAKGYTWFVMDSSLQDFDMNKKDLSSILSTFRFTD